MTALNPTTNQKLRSKRMPGLMLATIGVVYGDIGTSPLYAFKECFNPEHGIPFTPLNVLGVVSLIFWALTIVVSIKYVMFIMRANNNGEGGIFALLALVLRSHKENTKVRILLISLGIIGASMFYGDSVITPAISVLSAVEGLKIAAPLLGEHVVTVTLLIITTLFMLQKHGTTIVGKVFGPVICLWFVVIAILGVINILKYPSVLIAINPIIALQFFTNNSWLSFHVLGAAFLVVTGAEALYADMGHFGIKPIRLTWFGIAMPCLVLNYFGQGALVLDNPITVTDPFYLMVPPKFTIAMVVLSTFAAVVASQAVISGAFSLTSQAMKLGYCPRMQIRHTSHDEIGQVYIPFINWILFIAITLLILEFKSSSNLANAYGIAVSITMLITTLLASVVARTVWGWSNQAILASFWLLLAIDVCFVASNISKIFEGGWATLLLGGSCALLLDTWRKGNNILINYSRNNTLDIKYLLDEIKNKPPTRVQGTAVFMTKQDKIIPAALLHNLKHNKVIHERLLFLTIINLDKPLVSDDERIQVKDLGCGILSIKAYYGFLEYADVLNILSICHSKYQIVFELMDTSFFVSKQTIIPSETPNISLWREWLFAWMSRNAVRATDYFNIPPNRIVELGSQIEI